MTPHPATTVDISVEACERLANWLEGEDQWHWGDIVRRLRSQLTALAKPAYLRGKRSIVGAAILLPDGTVICGVRHLDKLMIGQLKAMGLDRLPNGSEQGFIANDYEFESRQSAWLIAERAGQFDPKNATGTQGVLYSEDLW